MTQTYAMQIELLLRGHANAEIAGPMIAYMRNQFPFLGIKMPQRSALTKQFMKENGAPSGEELEQAVRELWALPEREFQYTALMMLEKRVKEITPAQTELLEHIITTGSWWDTVDVIAGHLVGALFSRYPELIPVYTQKWIHSDNLWLRRTAILFQLQYKGRTDKELLFSFIRLCAGEEDFFIRKAIGWALREYSKTNPDAVRQFVAGIELSPLSKREALKRMG
ncbi:DNA alkylation repair protein [Paenibacillus solisilvae]|uniref:DNA alkylation repair protein n=1 Tax=Paenibacillus solisilvae TaxID=2486751 RepID=A0ABW0VPW0_9BACL